VARGLCEVQVTNFVGRVEHRIEEAVATARAKPRATLTAAKSATATKSASEADNERALAEPPIILDVSDPIAEARASLGLVARCMMTSTDPRVASACATSTRTWSAAMRSRSPLAS
jgi:hypothetical protein